MNSVQSKPLVNKPTVSKQTRVPVRIPTNLRSSNPPESTNNEKNIRRLESLNPPQDFGEDTPNRMIPKAPKKSDTMQQTLESKSPSNDLGNKKTLTSHNPQGTIPTEKSQTTTSTRIKLNLATNKPQFQNIFNKDIKAQLLKDLDKNKVENESLINNPSSTNVPTKKFDSSVRMRIVRQQNHQSPNTNQAQQEPEIEEEIKSPLGQGNVRNLRECQSIELEEDLPGAQPQRNHVLQSPQNRKEEEENKNTGITQKLKNERPSSGIRIRKIPAVKKEEFKINNVPIQPSKIGLGKSEFIGLSKKPEEMIPMQKSNIYADIKNTQTGKPMIESLYSEQDMKRLSLSHKMKGNEYYKLENYEKAIEEYSKAIKMYSQDSTYFSNRAVCYKILLQWDKVLMDCELSISIDKKNFRAANLKGHALIELGKKDKDNKRLKQGIQSLEAAMEVYLEKGEVGDVSIKNELETKVQKARKIDWLKDYQSTKKKKESTMDFINKLIDKDTKSKKKLKFDPKEAFNSFCKENSWNTQSEMPEYFCCKITFEFMKDPVLTSYGIGYEKSVIMEHFKKNGNFDPVTRRPIIALLPNKSLRIAIQNFIKNNPWAYEFVDADEDYQKISL